MIVPCLFELSGFYCKYTLEVFSVACGTFNGAFRSILRFLLSEKSKIEDFLLKKANVNGIV